MVAKGAAKGVGKLGLKALLKVAKLGRGTVLLGGEVLVLGPLGPLITRAGRGVAFAGLDSVKAVLDPKMRAEGLTRLPLNLAKRGTRAVGTKLKKRALLLGLFAWYQVNAALRRRSRIDTAASVQLLRRLNPQAVSRLMDAAKHSKQIFHQGSNYSWLQMTHSERMDWLNQILKDMWPYVDRMLMGAIADILEPLMNVDLPAGISRLSFDAFTLGTIPFEVTMLKVLEEDDNEVKIQVKFKWEGDPNIIFAVRGVAIYGNLAPIVLQLVNLQVGGVLQIRLRPLLDRLPMFGALSIMLVEEPEVRYDVKVKATPGLPNLKLESVNGLNRLILQIVDDILRDTIVFPFYVSVPIAENFEDPEEDRAHKEAAERVSAAATPSKKKLPLGSLLMSKGLDLATKEVENVDGDDDDDAAEKKRQGQKVKEQAEAAMRMLKKMPPIGYLVVDLIEARGLPKADTFGLSDPYALMGLVTGMKGRVKLGRSGSKSSAKQRTLTPKWNESFEFDVHSLELQTFALQVFDADFGPMSDDLLGECLIPLAELAEAENEPKDMWISLQGETKFSSKQGAQKANVNGEVHISVRWTASSYGRQRMMNAAAAGGGGNLSRSGSLTRAQQLPAEDAAGGGGGKPGAKGPARARLKTQNLASTTKSARNLLASVIGDDDGSVRPGRGGRSSNSLDSVHEGGGDGGDGGGDFPKRPPPKRASFQRIQSLMDRTGLRKTLAHVDKEMNSEGGIPRLSQGPKDFPFTESVIRALVTGPDLDTGEGVTGPGLWKIAAHAGGFPNWLSFPNVARVSWLNLLVAQLWPHIGQVLLHEVRLVNDCGILDFHPKIKDWIKMDEFSIGALTPVIHGIQVYQTQDAEVMMDVGVKFAGDPTVGVSVTPFKWWLSKVGVEVGEVQFLGTVRVRLGPLLPLLPLFAGVSMHLTDPPHLDASVKLRLCPWLPPIDLANLPGFVFGKSLIVRYLIRPEMEWPAGMKFPILDPESALVQRHIDLAGKVAGVMIVRLIEGRDLIRTDRMNNSDPYAVMSTPAGHHVGRGSSRQVRSRWRFSSVKGNTLNPEWDETFKFNGESSAKSPLTVCIFDEDWSHSKGQQAMRKVSGGAKRSKATIEQLGDLVERSRYLETLVNANPDLLREGIPWSPLVLELIDMMLWIYRKLHGLPQKGDPEFKSDAGDDDDDDDDEWEEVDEGDEIVAGGSGAALAALRGEPGGEGSSSRAGRGDSMPKKKGVRIASEKTDEILGSEIVEIDGAGAPGSPGSGSRLAEQLSPTKALQAMGSGVKLGRRKVKTMKAKSENKLKEMQDKILKARTNLTLVEQMISEELGRKGNDFMGMVIIEPGDMKAGEVTDAWYKLAGVPNGEVRLSMEWRPYIVSKSQRDWGRDQEEEMRHGTLFCEVVQCDNLKKLSGLARARTLRPFVELRAGGAVVRTPKGRGCFPIYSYQNEFIDLHPTEGTRRLNVRVWHQSSLGGDTFVGSADALLADVVQAGRVTRSYSLEDTNGRNTGTVLLRLRWRE